MNIINNGWAKYPVLPADVALDAIALAFLAWVPNRLM